jgi:glyoxylase-like metal-dependent hydrolase (beta-lactamase superfamily II)
MRRITDGIWQLDGWPPHAINAWLVDDILFDCRTRWGASRLLADLSGRHLSVIALTHAHPDHWGAAGAICAARTVSVFCHEQDADTVSGAVKAGAAGWQFAAGALMWQGPSYPDVTGLREDDVVGDFRVVHTPGHTPGHVIYFRERDRLAVIGDLFNTMGMWLRRRRLSQPPAHTSRDPAGNRRSIRKLLELRPSLVLPGHGPALSGVAPIEELAARLGV